ncbi:phage tail protein I [Novosphingobium huizhouense]|uniref:phage tail protein I n=1 Tax=Novosphingobium huizhouense TaxID=2866625 RepID=UPI001CD8B6E0|nr:phage tail protein I [Novosphingobium huizhouense]
MTASLLPPGATLLERALEDLAVVRLAGINSDLRRLWSARLCPPRLLPYLAWGLSVDQWDPDWPIRTRRARVADAIAVQRRKGTIDSVRRIVATFGGSITINEWWQQSPPGPPHTFSLTLELPSDGSAAPSSKLVDAVIAEISATKPLRSHFDFVMAQTATGAIGLRALARPVIGARLQMICPAAGS